MTDSKASANDKSIISSSDLVTLGQAANGFAAAGVFEDWRSRVSDNTLRRYDRQLDLFAEFLRVDLGAAAGDLAHDPEAWRAITWGLVRGFQEWLLARGYAVTSVNGAIGAVRVFAGLAFQAGALAEGEYLSIAGVKGYSRRQAVNIDGKRAVNRASEKKAVANVLTAGQMAALRHSPNPGTWRGRRDRLLFALFCDHALRVSEVVGLSVDCFDLDGGTITFYRPKVDRWDTHKLTVATLRAARDYLTNDAPKSGCVWISSRKGGGRGKVGLSTVAIFEIVQAAGVGMGIDNLSPHDLRHSAITRAARAGTPLDRLVAFGGWSSAFMALRYIEAAKIGNDGVLGL